jgi:glycosyltransferase involved in cell wall biosynthesis
MPSFKVRRESFQWRSLPGFAALFALAKATSLRLRSEVAERQIPREGSAVDLCVDLKRFSPRQLDSQLRASWSAAGGPIGLYVGELTSDSNAKLALRAFRAARALMPGARMVVVGDGPERRALHREFPEGVFVGALSGAEFAAHCASADVYVCADIRARQSFILEALASAVPVVAFETARGSEHIAHRLNGFLLSHGDEAGFVAATCLLASLHGELLPMRRHARDAAIAAVLMKHVGARSEASEILTANPDRRATSASRRTIVDASRDSAAPSVTNQRPS